MFAVFGWYFTPWILIRRSAYFSGSSQNLADPTDLDFKLVLSKILFVKGGFAKCYELKDKATGEIVAGKIVPKSMLTKAHQKEKMAQVKLVNLLLLLKGYHVTWTRKSDYIYLCCNLRLSLLGPGNPTTCIYIVFKVIISPFSGNPT